MAAAILGHLFRRPSPLHLGQRGRMNAERDPASFPGAVRGEIGVEGCASFFHSRPGKTDAPVSLRGGRGCGGSAVLLVLVGGFERVFNSLGEQSFGRKCYVSRIFMGLGVKLVMAVIMNI